MPLMAGIPNIDFEITLSIPSNQGSPTPDGKPYIAVSSIPPTLSPFAAAFLIMKTAIAKYNAQTQTEFAPKAIFFDMDGVLFDSMPNHAIAWEEVMKEHGLSFTARDCYINEGRTGESVIREAMQMARHRDATPDEIEQIYAEKSERFHVLAQQAGGTVVIDGVADVLRYVQSQGHQIWVVTGSGMRALLNNLNTALPPVFQPDRMVTAFDVTKGKFVLVFGTEHAGISDEVIAEADEFLKIPMCGMVDSLNVSASAAILIYMLSQRIREQVEDWQLNDAEKLRLLTRWTISSVRDYEGILRKAEQRGDLVVKE